MDVDNFQAGLSKDVCISRLLPRSNSVAGLMFIVIIKALLFYQTRQSFETFCADSPNTMFLDVLPGWERYAYWIIGPSSIAYSMCLLYLEGQKYKEILKKNQLLRDGWSWLGSQDWSDLEFFVWKSYTFTYLLPIGLLRVILSSGLFYFKCREQLRLTLILLLDVTAVSIVMGWRSTVLLLCLTILMYATTFLGSKPVTWILSMSAVVALSNSFFNETLIAYLKLNQEQFIFIPSLAFCYMKFLGYSLERIEYQKAKVPRQTLTPEHDHQRKESPSDFQDKFSYKHKSPNTVLCCARKAQNSNATQNPMEFDCEPNFLDLLFYIFYFPTFAFGPFIIYNDFHKQTKAFFRANVSPLHKWDILKQFARLAFWYTFMEIHLHFLYYNALNQRHIIIRKMSMGSALGSLYAQGQYFMVKYLLIYGISVQLARCDGLQPIPFPRCISWVYSYTDMWRYFDVGLYNFIKRYIYIPLGGSKAGKLRQILASGLAFIFIFWWHGADETYLVWCLGNFVTGALESLVPVLGHTSIGMKVKSLLSPAMQLRLKGMCIVPVYIASCVSISYFFLSKNEAKAMSERYTVTGPWYGTIFQFICFYANIQNAMYLTDRYKQQLKQHGA